jgi:hypothetical protein
VQAAGTGKKTGFTRTLPMGKEYNRISSNIQCLNVRKLPAALISNRGAHCIVWQSGGYKKHKKYHLDFVVKRHRLSCTDRDVALYYRDYRKLKESLQDMIPTALFVRTRVDGEPNLMVLARTFTPWFNIANPSNEDEALPLLGKLKKARAQLETFVYAAKQWRERESKVIDLFGIDNLVLDKSHQIRYLDSFGVFFHEDVLHLIDGVDPELEEKIDLSLKRLEYLEYLLKKSSP